MPKLPTSLDDLKPAVYNPRKISGKAASGLRDSIRTFGDISGIVWNSRTGNLVAGHQRVEQLRKLGARWADGAVELPTGERFAVRVVDWDEPTERAANLWANNPLIGGEFTPGALDLLEELPPGLLAEENVEDLRRMLEGEFGRPEVEEDGDGDVLPNRGMIYSVIVDFDDETGQAGLLTELEQRGMRCRLLIS